MCGAAICFCSGGQPFPMLPAYKKERSPMKPSHTSSSLPQTLLLVFPKTIPVMVGYLFLGTAYGILMRVNGFGVLWTFVCSAFVYGGSLQYLGITLLTSLIHPLSAFLLGLMISARHLFYGISMLSRYRSLKAFRPYLIYTLTDETFSIVCSEEVPPQTTPERFYLAVSLLDHSYWVLGSLAGSLVGSLLSFNTEGLDFALTALFVVIFTDQWKHHPDHIPALGGLAASVLGILIFGRASFIIPAMILIFVLLLLRYRKENR